MTSHWGPMLRAMAHNRRDYRFLLFATAVGFTVVANALAFTSVFKRALSFDTGFDDRHIVTVETESLTGAIADAHIIETALRRVPGVDEVAWMTRRAFNYHETGEPVAPIDEPTSSTLAWPATGDTRLMRALGLSLLAGRVFEARVVEDANADVEAVVSRSLATRLTGEDDPQRAVGARFLNGMSSRVTRIVGVVPDVALQISYVPFPNHALFTYAPPPAGVRHHAIVHVASADEATLGRIRDAVRLSGQWTDVISLNALHEALGATSRGGKTILIVVITTVLFVGLIGSFGVASFSVAERTRQIGIRRALGATRGDIIEHFLDESLLVTTGGLIAGLPLTLAVNAIAANYISEYSITWEHIVVSAVLFYITGIFAAQGPALRAAKIQPSVASQAT